MTQKQSTLLNLSFSLFLLASDISGKAQEWKTEEKFNVVFGLSQPLLCHGFNFEFNYIHKRIIFDFSQGVFLDFRGSTLPNELKNQHINVHMPWTVGFGVGYRITEWLNVRVEPKWHRFAFYYDNEDKYESNQITSYNTFTLGIGLYGCYQPFKKKENFLKGITIAPSIRYWPTVASTRDNNFIYYNKSTGTNQEIKTYGPGIGLTPFIINVSIGYSFQLKKKK